MIPPGSALPAAPVPALTVPPIDFVAVRSALAQAMQQACGLSSNAVVMMEPDQPVSVRPLTPFAAFMLTSPATAFGRDEMRPVDGSPELRNYCGPRSIAVQFQFFGSTHEEAYGMAAVWQASLDQEPTQEALAVGGLTVWQKEQIVDISALLFTGYEARASLNATFGVQSSMTVNIGTIESVPVSGTVANHEVVDQVAFTATLGD